jgi:asparagine synthase (glutamine-hydrolysing)
MVADRWRLRNEAIVDPPMWYDERYAVPHIDQPRQNFMFYPREYQLCDIVQGGGGRVLLTGQGPDEYLRGNMLFLADWLARGRVWSAVHEMARRAAIGRVSFWDLAYRNAVTPLLPGGLRRLLGPEVTRVPPWVNPTIVRRYDLHKRTYELALYDGQVGDKYHTSLVNGVTALRRTIGHLVLDDALDVRHPFLDRRLVEFGLRLPPELTARPHAGKWVLREAMRGILPESVRSRVGKGTQNERHAWSLTAQRPLLKPLVREPILADLGIVDGVKLRAAFHAAPRQAQRKGDPHAALQQVLAIEAWLQIRSGRWPRGLPQ